jgi:hypothetical protein
MKRENGVSCRPNTAVGVDRHILFTSGYSFCSVFDLPGFSPGTHFIPDDGDRMSGRRAKGIRPGGDLRLGYRTRKRTTP